MGLNVSKRMIIIAILVFTCTIMLSACSQDITAPGTYIEINAGGSATMTMIYALDDRAILTEAAEMASVIIPDNMLPNEKSIQDKLDEYLETKDINLKSFSVHDTYYKIVLSPDIARPISELDEIYPGIELGETNLKDGDFFLAPVDAIPPLIKNTHISLIGSVSAKSSDIARISESFFTGKTELVGNLDYNDVMVVYHKTYSLIDRVLIAIASLLVLLVIGTFVFKFIRRNTEDELL